MPKLRVMETTESKWKMRVKEDFTEAELGEVQARLEQRLAHPPQRSSHRPWLMILTKREHPDGKLLPQWPAPQRRTTPTPLVKPKAKRSRGRRTPEPILAPPILRALGPARLLEELPDVTYAGVDYQQMIEITYARMALIEMGRTTVWIDRVEDLGNFDAYRRILRRKPYPGLLPALCRRAIDAGMALIAWCEAGLR
jgi:hypothetical protein